MDRITSRPFLQVCSRCYKDLLRNFVTRTKAKAVTSSSSSRPATFSKDLKSLFHHEVLPRSLTSSICQSKRPFTEQDILLMNRRNMSLTRNNVFMRTFATETPQEPEKPVLRSKSRSKADENYEKSPITWKNLIIIGIIGGALVIGMRYVKQEKEEARQKAQNRKMGKAKLGGDWTLIDHHGNLRSSKDFRGQWLLIYFGFTNCPDICPEEMEKIVSVINKSDVDPDLPTVQPIIITVDPLRDTPEALKEYCGEFSPRLLGFSGTVEQIDVATRAYRVYYSAGPKDEDNDYIVDHSIISYLVNPEGEFVEYFGQNKKVDEIYSSMKLHILSYLKKKKANQK